MNASVERIKQDLRKIEELSSSLNGRVRVKSTSGSPVNRINLEINYPTAPSKDFPNKVQNKTEVRIDLLSRYPFQEPLATITTPVFHPNVYLSGKICFGTKWLPTQGLDLLVRRIIQIITFDATILNEESPANAEAMNWFREASRKHPQAFPTDKLIIRDQPAKKISWNDVSNAVVEKGLVSCPSCKASLSVPTGKKLNISCPKCNHKFTATT